MVFEKIYVFVFVVGDGNWSRVYREKETRTWSKKDKRKKMKRDVDGWMDAAGKEDNERLPLLCADPHQPPLPALLDSLPPAALADTC